MSDENTREVYRTLSSSLDKHTYFLLTAAGAGIAFATTQTQQSAINWTQLPLAIGVISWAMSFYFGCRHIQYGHSFLHANIDLHRVQSGRHPMSGDNPQLIKVGSDALLEIIEDKGSRSNDLAKRQFISLVSGGIFYVVWHIIEMSART